jgi:hypothetical protein
MKSILCMSYDELEIFFTTWSDDVENIYAPYEVDPTNDYILLNRWNLNLVPFSTDTWMVHLDQVWFFLTNFDIDHIEVVVSCMR